MNSEQMRERTMVFAVDVFKLVRPMFNLAETRAVAGQLLDSATSTAANYRASQHARSSREWRSKLGLVLEESDESVFWLLFIQKAMPDFKSDRALAELADEANQLTKIFGASLRTSKRNALIQKTVVLSLLLLAIWVF
jgi:four helix bundle protein